MSKLILHIGAHKTGTTSLQYFFANNRKVLNSLSVQYPNLHKNNAHHVLSAPWISQIPERIGYTKQDALAAWKAISDKFARTEQTVFLSGEVFSRMSPDKVDFKELSHLVSRFDEVEVLYVIREQATLCQSIFMQVTEDSKYSTDWATIIGNVFNKRLPTGVPLDHNQVLNNVLEGFDASQIHVATYSKLQESQENFYGFFLERCGINNRPKTLVFEPMRRNVSHDPLSHYICLQVSPWKGIIDTKMVNIIHQTIQDIYGAGKRTSLLTRLELKTFNEIFSPLNKQLLSRLENKSKYLALPVIQLPPDTLMRNQLTPEFWKELEQRLKNNSSTHQKVARKIRDFAYHLMPGKNIVRVE